MDFVRITSIDDPLFKQMYALMQRIFPPEEVLAFDLWAEPLQDDSLRVCVAVHEGTVVGATEYRYWPEQNVAMTDFTFIGQAGLGIGRFLYVHRKKDIEEWSARHKMTPIGMFAEIYDPYRASIHEFGKNKVMDPFVRREVLSHLGYKRIDFPYVHPSWTNTGEAVTELDLCFLPTDESMAVIPATRVADFLERYYSILENKPAAWHAMIADLRTRETLALLPL